MAKLARRKVRKSSSAITMLIDSAVSVAELEPKKMCRWRLYERVRIWALVQTPPECANSNLSSMQRKRSVATLYLRGSGEITPSQYRYFYRKAKGGSYRSISHLKSNIGSDGIELGGEE